LTVNRTSQNMIKHDECAYLGSEGKGRTYITQLPRIDPNYDQERLKYSIIL